MLRWDIMEVYPSNDLRRSCTFKFVRVSLKLIEITAVNLKGKVIPNQTLACLVRYLKIIFSENNLSILKQIVCETQKWHENISRPSGS